MSGRIVAPGDLIIVPDHLDGVVETAANNTKRWPPSATPGCSSPLARGRAAFADEGERRPEAGVGEVRGRPGREQRRHRAPQGLGTADRGVARDLGQRPRRARA